MEDEFAKHWVDAILREHLGGMYDQVEVHAVHGDGNAVSTHRSHSSNPAITFKSLCVIDGDSQQAEDLSNDIVRLPGDQPERTVFNSVIDDLDSNIAILTVSCQRDPAAQEQVRHAVTQRASTNRDPHLLFNQVGVDIGFIPEAIVRGAFLAIWARMNQDFCRQLSDRAKALIEI